MRVFVNNVDGYIAGSVCADLFKLSHYIIGTRKSRIDDLVPPVVKRLVPRVEVRRLLKAVASSDVVVYDLHDADLEELELVLRTLHISEISQELTIVLISSIGVWARTHRLYEEFPAAPEAASVAGEESPTGASTAAVEAEAAAAMADVGGEGAGEDTAAGGEAADVVDAPPVARRPLPLRSEDYTRRLPAPKFQEWKAIETQLLALKAKHNVRPYVVCAGIPYGNGEEPFLGLFKAAWQTRESLRVIGTGDNSIPMVHVRDVARCVKHIIEEAPSLDYHLAVDRGEVTQRQLIQAVADQYAIPYEIKSVSVAEAVLAELADILTMDLRMVPCDLMNVPYVEPIVPEVQQEAEDATANSNGEQGNAEPPKATGFRWWCEDGIVANIGKVANEFTTWRRLQPVRVIITGPPGAGAEQIASRLCERYNVPLVALDAQVEEQKKTDGSLGQELRTVSDQIATALSNPKEKNPVFFVPPELTMQVIQAALDTKQATLRGNVIVDFPLAADEATGFYLEDPPPPPPPGDDEEAGEPAPPLEKVVKASVAPDLIVMLKSGDEACLARAQEDGKLSENEVTKRLERWRKENPEEGPGLADVFREKFHMEPLILDVDEVSLEGAALQIAAKLETQRPVYNFMPLPPVDLDGIADGASRDRALSAQDEAALKREAEERRLKKEAEERLEMIKKEELQRLEHHSQPLRDYLMGKVVPSLREGLIEVCREVPEDPIGYLAEYLSIYAQAKRQRERRGARKRMEAAE